MNQKWKIPYTLREVMNLVLQPIKESQIKSKTVMSWSWREREKKEFIFCMIYFSEGNFFIICFFSI